MIAYHFLATHEPSIGLLTLSGYTRIIVFQTAATTNFALEAKIFAERGKQPPKPKTPKPTGAERWVKVRCMTPYGFPSKFLHLL